MAAAPAFAADPSPKPSSAAGDVSLKTEVNKAFITIGDPVDYTVTIRHDSSVKLLTPIPPPDENVFKIQKVQDIRREERYGMIVEGRKYTLTTFALGEFILEPLEIQYRAGAGEPLSLQTDRIYITVKSVSGKEPKFDIKGLKSVLALPRKVVGWLLALLLVLAALTAFFIYQRVRRPAETVKAVEPPKTPEEEAIFELTRLFESDLIRRGKIKEYYLRLSEVLRIYFERRFGIPAIEATTFEILKQLRQNEVDRGLIEKISEVLEAADLAKFAKWKPEPPEIITINQKAKQIVEMARPAQETRSGV